MTSLGVVQARMGSSRLPGKVLLDLTPGESVLERVCQRLGRSTALDRVIVATTRHPDDDAIERLCHRIGVDLVRGDTHDVLDRYVQAISGDPDCDVVVRVTADCPFVDPETVDSLVDTLKREGADYVSNRLPPPYRRTYPVGLDVEACTREALERAWKLAKQAHQREHVTPFLYENPDDFRIRIVDLPEDLSEHRWTVDTADDLEVARRLAKAIGPEPFGWRKVLEVVLENPGIEAPNRGHQQKLVTETDERSGSPNSADQ